MKSGELGKLVHTLVQNFVILYTNKYNSNPYRKFDGNDDDRYGREIKHDILVLKNTDSYFSGVKPVIVVDGSCAGLYNGRLAYQYNTTVHFNNDGDYDELAKDVKLSSDESRLSFQKTFLKSDLEKYYKRFSTVKEVTEKVLEDAVKSYNLKTDMFEMMMLQQQMSINIIYSPSYI